MNRNLMIGIVAVLVLLVLGWWYYATMMPKTEDEGVQQDEAATESVNGVAVPDEEAAVTLAGAWKSTDDARFTRSFTANGTVTDRYEGDDSATVSGKWSFVEDPKKEQAELPAVKDAKVVKLQFPEEVMYFALTELSASGLSMTYLTGNGTLEFTRIR